MYIDGCGDRRKTWLPDFQLVDAERQALHIQATLIAGGHSISILIRLADDLHRCFHRQTGRIGHSKAQLTAIALAEERRGAKENNSCKSHHEDSAFVV